MRILRSLFAVLFALVALGLAGPAHAEDDDEKPVILVFSSTNDARSQEIVQAFKDGVGTFAIRMSYDLSETQDAAYFIADNLRGMEVDLVFAVGDKALKAAAREFVGVPVIYTDASASTAASIGRTDVYGVAKRVDPRVGLERLQVLMPKLDTVGAIYSTRDTDAYWTDLAAACEALGLKFVPQRVATPGEVPNAQAGLMAKTDVIWMQEDDGLWTGSTLARAFHDSSLAEFPLVTFSIQHFQSPQKPGIVMVTNPSGVGATAATIASQILVDRRAPETVTQGYPAPVIWAHRATLLSNRVLLTKKTAAAIDEWAQ